MYFFLSVLFACTADPWIDTGAATDDNPPQPSITVDVATAPSTPPDTTPGTTPPTTPDLPAAFNLCGAPQGPRASGTWDDPVSPDWLPLVDTDDTSISVESVATVYDCEPGTTEEGSEVVYALSLPGGWFRAEVDEDSGVDVDIHLLYGDAIVDADGFVTGCVERANTVLELDYVDAGDYLLVVDTWSNSSGDISPGGYTLAVEAFADGVWSDVEVSPGVVWSHLRERGGPRDDQSVDVVSFDPTLFEVAPVRHEGCEKVPNVAEDLGAIAAVNTAFFEFDGVCSSLDMVRRDATTYATNRKADPQRTLVWDDGGSPEWRWIPEEEDHLDHDNAIGGWPSLVSDGVVLLEPAGTDSFHTSRHPRAAVAIRDDGHLFIATADGRSVQGDGMTTAEWAEQLVELGAIDAINVDGGGSATLTVAGCSLEGTVNHPSDGGGDDHGGARSVSAGLYLLP